MYGQLIKKYGCMFVNVLDWSNPGFVIRSVTRWPVLSKQLFVSRFRGKNAYIRSYKIFISSPVKVTIGYLAFTALKSGMKEFSGHNFYARSLPMSYKMRLPQLF